MSLLKTAFITPALPRRAKTRPFPSRAAGSGATEAYPQGYVAGRRASENAAGGCFQQPCPFIYRMLKMGVQLRLVPSSRLFKTASSKAAGSTATEAYPQGTSQGGGRLRTPLEGVFNSLNYELYEV